MHIILLFMNCYSSTININELMIGIKSTDCFAVFFSDFVSYHFKAIFKLIIDIYL